MEKKEKPVHLVMKLGPDRWGLKMRAYRYEGAEPTIRIGNASFTALLGINPRIGFCLHARATEGRGFTLSAHACWGAPNQLLLFGRRVDTTIALWPGHGSQIWDWERSVWTDRYGWFVTHPANRDGLAKRASR